MERTAAVILLAFVALPALGQGPVKIGLITTLSTPGGYLGQDMRDAFELAVKEEGGRLGGVPVELVVSDDGANPNTAALAAQRMLQRDEIRIFSGTIFSVVGLAIVPEILRAGAFVISSNTAPKELDGKNCHPNYFALAWHNDGPGEMAGIAANLSGSKRVITIAANFTAGLEQVAAFNRNFKGQIIHEILVRLNQTDYAVEVSEIKARNADGIYIFLPGGMGIGFLRQMQQAGVRGINEYTGTTVDGRIMQSIGGAGMNVVGSTTWGPDLDNSTNRRFVAAYQEAFKRIPTVYAANGYDAARLIGAALRASRGNVSNAATFRAALRAARFESVRGKISFGKSQHVVQDWYMTKAMKSPSGQYDLSIVQKLVSDHGSPYAEQCQMR